MVKDDTEPMRVLVCGGRDYLAQGKVLRVLDALRRDTVIVHGGAKGADQFAGTAARVLGMEEEVYEAEWGRYGKRAGPKRNHQMLDSGIDLVIAFPGGVGTGHMKRIAKSASVLVLEVH